MDPNSHNSRAMSQDAHDDLSVEDEIDVRHSKRQRLNSAITQATRSDHAKSAVVSTTGDDNHEYQIFATGNEFTSVWTVGGIRDHAMVGFEEHTIAASESPTPSFAASGTTPGSLDEAATPFTEANPHVSVSKARIRSMQAPIGPSGLSKDAEMASASTKHFTSERCAMPTGELLDKTPALTLLLRCIEDPAHIPILQATIDQVKIERPRTEIEKNLAENTAKLYRGVFDRIVHDNDFRQHTIRYFMSLVGHVGEDAQEQVQPPSTISDARAANPTTHASNGLPLETYQLRAKCERLERELEKSKADLDSLRKRKAAAKGKQAPPNHARPPQAGDQACTAVIKTTGRVCGAVLPINHYIAGIDNEQTASAAGISYCGVCGDNTNLHHFITPEEVCKYRDRVIIPLEGELGLRAAARSGHDGIKALLGSYAGPWSHPYVILLPQVQLPTAVRRRRKTAAAATSTPRQQSAQVPAPPPPDEVRHASSPSLAGNAITATTTPPPVQHETYQQKLLRLKFKPAPPAAFQNDDGLVAPPQTYEDGTNNNAQTMQRQLSGSAQCSGYHDNAPVLQQYGNAYAQQTTQCRANTAQNFGYNYDSSWQALGYDDQSIYPSRSDTFSSQNTFGAFPMAANGPKTVSYITIDDDDQDDGFQMQPVANSTTHDTTHSPTHVTDDVPPALPLSGPVAPPSLFLPSTPDPTRPRSPLSSHGPASASSLPSTPAVALPHTPPSGPVVPLPPQLLSGPVVPPKPVKHWVPTPKPAWPDEEPACAEPQANSQQAAENAEHDMASLLGGDSGSLPEWATQPFDFEKIDFDGFFA